MANQRLGGYVFEWNPDEVTIPESKKTVAIQETYGGSAIFQWSPLLEGAMVELKWNWMPREQYSALRLLYLSTAQVEWNPQNGGETFFVYVVSLTGEYFPVALADIGYRANVKMILQIRTQGSTTSTTVTTTTSTAP